MRPPSAEFCATSGLSAFEWRWGPAVSRFSLHVLGQSMRWGAVGIGVGAVAALSVVGFVRSILFGVSAYDATVFVTAGLVLVTIMLLASTIDDIGVFSRRPNA